MNSLTKHRLRAGRLLAGLCVLTLGACATQPVREQERAVEAVSLFGEPLVPPAVTDPEELKRLWEDLDEAMGQMAVEPAAEESYLWVGRRLAYLGSYGAAIHLYSRGLELHPESYRLLRHRGHRYVTVRELDRAIADLSRAAELAADHPDAIEPDGAPNDQNVPRSTTHSNIYYHLGLAHYLKGDYEAALEAYRRGLEFSRVNDDMLVATSYWMVLTLERLGMDERMARVLADIQPEMDVLENHAYHELLLLFAGKRSLSSIAVWDEGGIQAATRGYGVARYLASRGRHDDANRLLERIVDETDWRAFGHLAAEAELYHQDPNPR